MTPTVHHFLHRPTGTFSYVVHDPSGPAVAVIDPVLDYDAASARTGTTSVEAIIAFVEENAFEVQWILETHAHADHLSAAPVIQERLGGKIAIGEGIRRVQNTFRGIFDLEDLAVDGSQFDHLFADGETFRIGELEARVIETPGHTSDSVSYRVGDAVFVGDTLFAPDLGSARTDFPGGDARKLYRSIRRILTLPPDTRVYLCHDYPPEGRGYEPMHSVRRQRDGNVHVGHGMGEDAYVELREARDATLGSPALIIPAIQVNINAGRLPAPSHNGIAYLKVPLDTFGRGG